MKNRIVLHFIDGAIKRLSADQEAEFFLFTDDDFAELIPWPASKARFGSERVDEIVQRSTLNREPPPDKEWQERFEREHRTKVHINVSYEPRRATDLFSNEAASLLLFTTGRHETMNDPDLAMYVHPSQLEAGLKFLESIVFARLRVGDEQLINLGNGQTTLSLICRECDEDEQCEMMARLLRSAALSDRVVEISPIPELKVIGS